MTKFINRGKTSTKSGFGEGVLQAGKDNTNVIILGADITASVGLNLFKNVFPERFYSMGIAEQNCIGVGSGMALSGKTPVFATYGVFSALRTTDFIRISVCYNNLHVIIGGAHAGISVGPDGATHQALEDIAVMRVLPNMTILSPCDATQTKIATYKAINELDGPVYIRFGRTPVPDFTDESQEFIPGKAQVLKEGKDLCIIATGHLVWEALQAAYELDKRGTRARVINMHTIKPLDEKELVKAAQETGKIITAEEHQIIGGLGSAVAECLARNHPAPIEFVGINDSFGESGDPEELIKKYKIDSEEIIKRAYKLLEVN